METQPAASGDPPEVEPPSTLLEQPPDRGLVVAVCTVACTAWATIHHHLDALPRLAVPTALGLAVGAAALGLASRGRGHMRAVALLALAAAALSQNAVASLEGPPTSQPVNDQVTLVSDPRPTPGGSVRAEAQYDGRRVALVAHRSAAAGLRHRLAGEQVLLMGELHPPGRHERFLPHRRLSGRLDVEVVMGWSEGHGVTRAANWLRRTLVDGSTSLGERQQSLLSGLLLGDERHQPGDLTDAFRDSGLAHLLAVSGDNVALLLVLLGPLLCRLRLAPRLVVTLSALAFFALLTRGEPSVLRATGMATVGAAAAATGRPVSPLRRLCLAVAGVLLIDPLLVTSAGFQLSVAGTTGIVLGARRLADRLAGPRWFTLPVAVTLSAELAVAPVVAFTFGAVPLVSTLANLLAAPASAPIKLWGLTAGLLAGLTGEPLATWLHVPTRVMLWWLDGVASVTAHLPVGQLSLPQVLLLLGAGAVMAAAVRVRRVVVRLGLRTSGAGVVAGTLLVAVFSAGHAPVEEGLTEIGPGMDLWRAGTATVMVVDGRAAEERLLDGLRRAQLDGPALLVLRTASPGAVRLAVSLAERWPTVPLLAPPEVVAGTDVDGATPRLPGALAPLPDSPVQVGRLRLAFEVSSDRIDPTVTVAPPG